MAGHAVNAAADVALFILFVIFTAVLAGAIVGGCLFVLGGL